MKHFNAWIRGTHTHDSEIRSVLNDIEFHTSVPLQSAGTKTWSKRFTIPGTAGGIPMLCDISGSGITTPSSLIIRTASGLGFVLPHRLGEGTPSAPSSAWHGQPVAPPQSDGHSPAKVSGVWALLNAGFPVLPQSNVSIALLTMSGEVEVDIIIIGT